MSVVISTNHKHFYDTKPCPFHGPVCQIGLCHECFLYGDGTRLGSANHVSGPVLKLTIHHFQPGSKKTGPRPKRRKQK